jgi:hypothetical protein
MATLIGNYIPLNIQFQVEHAWMLQGYMCMLLNTTKNCYMNSWYWIIHPIVLYLYQHVIHTGKSNTSTVCVWDRVVCTVTRLWTGRSRVWFLARVRDVFLRNIQISCGVHSAPCSVHSGSRVAGAWSWPLPSTANVRTGWSCTLASHVCHCGDGQLHLYLWCSLFY